VPISGFFASSNTTITLLVAILCIAFGLILGLAAFGLAGYAGEAIFTFTFSEVGIASFLLPIILVGGGLGLALEESFVSPVTLAGLALILVATLTFLGIVSAALGGAAGVYIAGAATTYFGLWGTVVLLLALTCVGLIIAADIVVIAKALSILGRSVLSAFTYASTTNFLATGSSTLQRFTFTNATGTSATTTNFFSTTASSTNLFSTIGKSTSVTLLSLFKSTFAGGDTFLYQNARIEKSTRFTRPSQLISARLHAPSFATVVLPTKNPRTLLYELSSLAETRLFDFVS
jgi:hypothetical protein